jgi:unsaturated rhamnogalacturonyl hydrolase
MPTTLRLHSYEATDIHRYIELLIHNLVNIKDTTGRFLLKLDDGRIIDTKGQPIHKPTLLISSILTNHRLE